MITGQMLTNRVFHMNSIQLFVGKKKSTKQIIAFVIIIHRKYPIMLFPRNRARFRNNRSFFAWRD